MAHGARRVSRLIQRKLADLLLREVHDPRIRLVTITKVELSRDRAHCKVFWSTLAEGGARTATQHGLDDARPFLQRRVGAVLRTRITPALQFVFDPSMEGVERVSRLLRKAQEEDEEPPPGPEGTPQEPVPDESRDPPP